MSTAIGAKGFTYNTRGRVSASIPGTGIRFTHNLKSARRTSRPARSVVAGSQKLDAGGYERLSKRELATRDFVEKVQLCTASALVNFFFSHGVYVRAEDLSDAVTLEGHQHFLNSLSSEFETTTNAIRLAVDIDSISLGEKVKAMRAVYEIEKQCAEHQGQQVGLAQAAAALQSAVRSYPSAPSLVSPFVIGLAGSFITYAVSVGAGFGLTTLAILFGVANVMKYLRGRNAALAAVEEADQRFDLLSAAEITTPPQLLADSDNVKPKAVGLACATLLAALIAAATHISNSVPNAADSFASKAPTTVDANVAQAPIIDASQAADGLKSMIGKYPYDVVSERRFKAAFRGVPRADWKKIFDRLAVANQTGIQSKDGFLVGDGCKDHECNAEKPRLPSTKPPAKACS